MKGIGKAFSRTPQILGSKVGLSKKSVDPEFAEYLRYFEVLEKATEKLLKDSKSFTEGVISLFTSGVGVGTHFSTIFHPIAGEFDLIGKHPEARATIQNVEGFETTMEELRTAVSPELDLIESRIVGPTKELQVVIKTIRKTITKRDHKLTDYDRFNNSLTKLRDKKEKSLSDEKNLFKLEQDFEVATTEYDYLNNALKTDLPRFMTLCTQFIDPLFHSYFYMQLNIFYVLLEKLNGFADGKYEVASLPGAQIAADYEEKRTDAWATVENLNIVKRIISVSRLVQANRTGLGRTPSTATTSSTSTTGARSLAAPPPQRSPSQTSLNKKAPPPPPSFAAAPPPYSAGTSTTATKRAPPPPPPLKPKPKLEPQVQYVVALYDFAAQADGDLSFNAGDRIEVVQRTANAEDWWTGRLNGQEGVFPGNYVQDT